MSFRKDFLWGAASGAPQIEGAWNEDGRTPSIWDAAPASRLTRGETCHVAADHYHRYKEDVALMKEIGLKSYRFSVSWSRVCPAEGVVNEAGVRFYADLTDELVRAGIEPLVTLYHWDLPVWVYERGGWESPRIVKLFEDYARAIVPALAGKVRWWMTINEPQVFIMAGYHGRYHAPFLNKPAMLSTLTKNVMRAHAAAYDVIRACRPDALISLTMASGAYLPLSDAPEGLEEARGMTVDYASPERHAWWLDPLVFGRPVEFNGHKISEKEAKEVQRPLDYLALNCYQPWWRNGETRCGQGDAKTSMGWVIRPECMYYMIRFVYDKYRLPIVVSENGMADNDALFGDGKVHDPLRAEFIRLYLGGAKRAADEGAPVLGYQYWSLLDDFEWTQGYDPRFGLIYVDYKTGKRTIKDSAYEYKKIIAANGENL